MCVGYPVCLALLDSACHLPSMGDLAVAAGAMQVQIETKVCTTSTSHAEASAGMLADI